MKKLISAVVVCAMSTSASAWGEREQSALLGLVIGSAVTHHVNRQANQPSAQPNYQQPNVVYVPVQQAPEPQVCGYNITCYPQPQPVYTPLCYQESVYDQYGRIVGYRQVCR